MTVKTPLRVSKDLLATITKEYSKAPKAIIKPPKNQVGILISGEKPDGLSTGVRT